MSPWVYRFQRPNAKLEKSLRGRARRAFYSVSLAVALQLSYCGRSNADNHADYRYNAYLEEKGRIEVQTHSVLFEQNLNSQLTAFGNYVHDAVSGASPTGAPPPRGSSQVPLAQMHDVRNAGNLAVGWHYGRNTLTPSFSYSLEDDYQSIGVALADAVDFNNKNTTVSAGYAHNFDSIFPAFWAGKSQQKNSDDFFVGLTQLLSPVAYVSANLTYGRAHGYLADPYKGVRFDGYPDPNSLFPEKRPSERTKEAALFTFNYFVAPAHGSVEATYRLYHDSYGIWSQTASLAWYQKIGQHVTLSPLFRFDTQTAASFYATRFPGDPSDPQSPVPVPQFYSADYRLSALNTFTYGLTASVMIKEFLYLDFGYERYVMVGTDGVTSASAYPTANIFNAGFRLWW